MTEEVSNGKVGARRRIVQSSGVDPGDGRATKGNGGGQTQAGIGIVNRAEPVGVVGSGICHAAIFFSRTGHLVATLAVMLHRCVPTVSLPAC